MMELHSLNFGKKERVLNYACQTYQLSRPSKVGAVMELIRQCQPNSIEEWEQWYFSNAYTNSKTPVKITRDIIHELGERLYAKITQIVIPEWQEAFMELTEQDCVDYIYNLTINRTYDGYVREKSVVYDGLAKIFTNIEFKETDPELDHSGDIDFTAAVGNSQIGFQIKPITANSNFGGYSLSERMKHNFDDFTRQFGGKVFVIFSMKGEIANQDVIADIENEIKRLSE